MEQEAVPFSYPELQAFERFAALLRPNPRHLKRMVNVYRLVRTLAHSNADDALLENPAAMIRWLVMWGQWPYTSLKMLERFDELLEETAEGAVPEGLGDGDPLVYLLGEVEPGLDALTRERLDDEADDLRTLLKAGWRRLLLARAATHPEVHRQLQSGRRGTAPGSGRRSVTVCYLVSVTVPSSAIVQCGLWAISQGWPSGSTKTPE